MTNDKPFTLRELRPLPPLESPEAKRAFAGYIPSIMRREPTVVNAMGLGVQHVRTLPPSYPWAGTIVKDTFYGTSGKPARPQGMTSGDDTNYYDCEEPS